MEHNAVNDLKSGTIVWLHSLTILGLNGKIALMMIDSNTGMNAGAQPEQPVSQCNVCMLDDNSVFSVGLANISLSPPAYFNVREAPGTGGIGVFAMQDIAAGVRLFAEPPLFTVPINAPFDIAKTLSTLSSTQQDAFHLLYDCQQGGGPITDQGIYNTNCFVLGEVPTRAGIFLLTCKLNHSCAANCSHAWNSELGMKTVQTDRDVKCGEELMLTYSNYFTQAWEIRQESLKAQYNFSCCCQACKLTGEAREASDARRAKIGELGDCMEKAYQTRKFSAAVQLVEQRLQLMLEEGIASPNQMSSIECEAYQACKLDGNLEGAVVWLERALVHKRMAQGDDSPATKMLTGMLTRLVASQPMTFK